MNKKKIIFIVVLVVLVLSLAYFLLNGSDKGLEVSTIEVSNTNILRTVDMSGGIFANEIQEITLPQGIRVLKVNFLENDPVKVGDVIGILDTSQLNIQLEKAKINLNQLEADIKDPGRKIPSGDRGILANNIDKANESYKKAEGDLSLAKERLEDLRILYENGAISQAELNNQINLVGTLEVGLKTASLNVKDAKLKLSDYSNQTATTRDDLTRQRQASLLDIEAIKDDIEDSTIKAEINGLITKLDLKENRLTKDNELVRIQDPNSFKFIALVPQEDALLIEKDQKAKVVIAGVANEYQGIVSSKSKTASVDQSSGSSTPKVEIKIDILNEDNYFVSGFDADARVETGLVENTLSLNNEAIKKDEGGNYFVFLVDSNNKAKKTIIETGLTDGYKTQIVSGLSLGDKVVSNPPIELKDGSLLKIK